MTQADGVVTMEIPNCKVQDSGNYRCVASNVHGQDETACVVIVEGTVREGKNVGCESSPVVNKDRST